MADTLGIGSYFRALCTIPSLLALGKDISELCPQAWLYNYTNPMAALVWSIYEGTAHRRVVGVHVRAEHRRAAGRARRGPVRRGVVADGWDEPPGLAAAIRARRTRSLPAARRGDRPRSRGLGRRVRVEIYRRFGLFPSESSEHARDLVPWFLPMKARSNGSGSRSTNTSIGASATSGRTRRFAASSRPGSRSASSAGPSTRRRSSTRSRPGSRGPCTETSATRAPSGTCPRRPASRSPASSTAPASSRHRSDRSARAGSPEPPLRERVRADGSGGARGLRGHSCTRQPSWTRRRRRPSRPIRSSTCATS